jgi:molecular chaperone DnaK (HSP70)
VEVFQGEEAFVQANTKIGEVRITGLDPLPRGQQALEVKFSLDVSGTLSTICTDLRTKKAYTGSFTFDGITRMSGDEIKKRRQVLQQMMAPSSPQTTNGPPSPAAQSSSPQTSAAAESSALPTTVPELQEDQIPKDYVVYWKEGKDCLNGATDTQRPILIKAMTEFARAVLTKDPKDIEAKSFLLQDALLEVRS